MMRWGNSGQAADSFYQVRPDYSQNVPSTKFKIKAGKTLSVRKWHAAFTREGCLDIASVLSRIQRGGVHPAIMGEVWEFLLGCYDPGSTFDERDQIRHRRRMQYARWKEECREMDSHVGSGKIITAPIINEDGFPFKDPLVLLEATSDAQGTSTGSSGVEVSNSTNRVIDRQIIDWKLTLHQIGLDVLRTDRSMVFYENKENLSKLWDILAVYAWIDKEVGYCQGMSDLCSPMIVLLNDEADAFWCFERLMRRLRGNFRCTKQSVGVENQLQHLASIIQVLDPKLHDHLETLGGGDYLFAFRMFMVLFRRELSFGDSLYLWEVPYYLAEMTEKIAQEDRIPVLKASQDHLKEFIALCEVLELIPEDELELSRQKQPDTMANRRAQKVARFKHQKAAETKLQEIRERKERRGRSLRAAALSAPIETGEEDDLEDDGEEEREAWLATISLALCKAFDLLDMLKKEEEMLLAVKERKAKDGNAFAREMLDERTKKAEAWHHNAANRVAYSKPADPITCATFAQDVIEGRASISQAHEHKHQPLIFGPANLVGGGLTSERERMAAQVFQPSCRMPTMSIEEAGLREMKMMEKWQERAAKMMKEANSAWHKDGTSSAQEDEDAINFALLPDEALLASQLEGARRSSIEKAYNAALREAEKRHTGRRTKPTAHWPKEVMEVFQMIYMATCMTKEVRFKRGEENWVDDPIVHDMALELFARTQRAYSGQQLYNKWKNMKLDKILKEEDQKLDIEGPNLPPPASTPPPQHLGFTATANGMEIDTSQPPIVFKSQLYTLTGVPPECQKIIGKGGTLEDNGNWSDLGVKDGQKLMMIGTNAAITKVLQEEVDTLVIAAANNPSTRELSKSLQLPAIEFLLEENGHKSDLEILRKKMEHLDIENKKDKDELQQEIAILKKRLAHAMEEKMGYINEVDLLKNQLSDMHNQLMELKGSIRVFCRVRPILDKSSSEDGAVYCLEKGQFVGRRVYLETSSGAIKAFTCDRVFPPGVSQNDIFVEISGLMKSAIDSKKVCIFAYGQTGSGKTFTMLGDDGDDAKGVIPRVVEEIFETIHIRESLGLAHHTVKIDMSEIYNEEVRNLSSMASNDNVVKTKTQALGALKEVLSKRAVAKTSRNERSSRSHFIFRLSIYSYNEKMETCEGALNIIDLAGSEAAYSDATKKVQAEAKCVVGCTLGTTGWRGGDNTKVRCCHWISIYVEAGFESIVGGYEKKGIKDGI